MNLHRYEINGERVTTCPLCKCIVFGRDVIDHALYHNPFKPPLTPAAVESAPAETHTPTE